MDYVILTIIIVLIAYLVTVYSAYKEVREKNLEVKFSVQNVLFFLMIPAAVSKMHLKMAINFLKEGQKEQAKLLLTLSTFKISSGIAIFLEFVVHTAIVDTVYGRKPNGVKIIRESKSVSKSVLNKESLMETIQNPLNYGKTIFNVA